jgi:hypothetical protein
MQTIDAKSMPPTLSKPTERNVSESPSDDFTAHLFNTAIAEAESIREQALRHMPNGDWSRIRNENRRQVNAAARALALESQLNSMIASAADARRELVEGI